MPMRVFAPKNLVSRSLVLLAVCLFLVIDVAAEKPKLPMGHTSTPWDILVRRLAKVGVENTPEALLEAVQSHDRSTIRAYAAMLLGERGDLSARPVLLGVSRNDSDPTVRLVATDVLCRMVSDDECLALLKVGFEAATSPEEQVRWGCRLAPLGDARGLPLFRRRLEDPATRPDTMHLLDCFLGLEAPGFQPKALLFEWLNSEDPEVRSLAVDETSSGLLSGALQLGEVESILEALRDDADPEIRRRAEAALRNGRWKRDEAMKTVTEESATEGASCGNSGEDSTSEDSAKETNNDDTSDGSLR